MGFSNFVRGTLSLGVTILIGYLIFHFAAEAYQLDIDGEIGIGQVASTTERTTHRRRGRSSIRYELEVASPHGMLSISSHSRIAPGEHVRYIYSPTSKIAQQAPEPLQRGDMLWAYFRSFTTIILAFGFLCCAIYVYKQYWWIYVIASGRYTVNGKHVNKPDAGQRIG